jgi:hypothetical protein
MTADGRSEAYVIDGLLMALKRMTSWAAQIPRGQHCGLPPASNPLARWSGFSVPRRARRDSDPAAVSRLLK